MVDFIDLIKVVMFTFSGANVFSYLSTQAICRFMHLPKFLPKIIYIYSCVCQVKNYTWLISCTIHTFLTELSTFYVVSARYPIKDRFVFRIE